MRFPEFRDDVWPIFDRPWPAVDAQYAFTHGGAQAKSGDRAVAAWRLFNMTEMTSRPHFPRDDYRETIADLWVKVEEPDLIPITLGNWRGNFMYDRRWYFGPSLLAWPQKMRQEYYQWTRDQGYSHLWINGQQDNWDPRYTHGGYDAFSNSVSMVHLVSVLVEIRQAQLIPCVGIHDQPQAARLPWETLISQTQRLIDATFEHVALYMVMGWELNENDRWATGGVRNPAIIEMFQRIDPRGRDLGVHYAPPALGNTDGENGEEDLVFGGFQLWQQLPSHAVRLQQLPKEANTRQLEQRTEAAALVHRGTGTKICSFEHSRMSVPGRKVDPNRPLADAEWRARICMNVLSSGLPASRIGSMNG